MNTPSRQDILQGYENLKRCIDVYIASKGIMYATSSNAPSTYKAMVNTKSDLGLFVVYDGGDHGLLGEEYNIKFRAVHDYGHLVHGLTFKFDDERELSRIQAADLALIGWNVVGLTAWEVHVIMEIVQAEIGGQIDYYVKNNQYVNDQTKFIMEYFKVE